MELHKRKALKITAIIASVLLLAGAVVSALIYKRVDDSLTNIKRESLLPTESSSTSPPEDPSAGQPLTYLLLGSDKRPDGEPARSDSIMVAQVPKDRRNVYLIGIPRDLYVDIPGHPKQKINAAYQFGGAQLTVRTVQDLIKTKINHVAVIDFDSFIKLVDALGGVTIDNPYSGTDTEQNVSWKKGSITLNNEKALQYVRWRHGLPNGDITRSQNQQRVVKAIMAKALSKGVLTNPSTMDSLLQAVTKNVTIDNSFTNDLIRGTLLSMRIKSSEDVKSITFPIKGYMTHETYGDVDLVDKKRLEELRTAFKDDALYLYQLQHEKDPVAGEATVPDPQ